MIDDEMETILFKAYLLLHVPHAGIDGMVVSFYDLSHSKHFLA
jgi:hypothetical protein